MAAIMDLEKALSATAVARQGRIYRKTLYGDFCRYERLSYKSLRKCFFIRATPFARERCGTEATVCICDQPTVV